jgi:Family of unknown function (DUF6152)
MKAAPFTLLGTAMLSIALASAVFAHHSISAEFDGNRRIMLAGTVTKVEWTNPHSFFYVDAKDPKTGSTVTWACELGSPNMLSKLGWTRATLKVGMMVSFTGTLARDGSHKVIPRNIVADGTNIVAWPSEHNTP